MADPQAAPCTAAAAARALAACGLVGTGRSSRRAWRTLAQVEQDKRKSKFAHMLHEDVSSLVQKLEKAAKFLETMVHKQAKDKDVKKLSVDLVAIDSEFDSAMLHGSNFGYETCKSRSKTSGCSKRKRSA